MNRSQRKKRQPQSLVLWWLTEGLKSGLRVVNCTLRDVGPISSRAASHGEIALIWEVGKKSLYRAFRLYVGGKSGKCPGGGMLVLVCFIII